jgi:hypothetical protein
MNDNGLRGYAFCKVCGDVADRPSASDTSYEQNHGRDLKYLGDCPGKGKHVILREKVFFFGLLKKVICEYYYTGSKIFWYSYIGPTSRFWLWLALKRVDYVCVDDELVWWSSDFYFQKIVNRNAPRDRYGGVDTKFYFDEWKSRQLEK